MTPITVPVEELTDEQIAVELAKGMGWYIMDSQPEWWTYDHHEDHGEHGTEVIPQPAFEIKEWSPATRWDHIGIVIKYMQREWWFTCNFGAVGWMRKTTEEKGLMPVALMFHEHSKDLAAVDLGEGEDVTPRHIALAALAALREAST